MDITALELTAEYGYGYGSGSGYGYGSGSGYGSGDGDGSGDGYGYGSGSGYGSGDGDGSGDGYGYGYGSGYGSGSGYGYGSGSGYGSGDGYGDGYGSGYGSGYGEDYCSAILSTHRAPPEAILAFWRSNSDGTPANGGTGTKANEGLVEEIKGPLKICTRSGLHGTLNPKDWKGEHWWVVALHEPVVRQDNKMASLKRTFIKHLGKCPF